MVGVPDDRERYLQARTRATQALRLAESLHATRISADIEAAGCYEELLTEAEQSDDAIVRAAAGEVRSQRAALRSSGDVLARALLEMIERLVSVEADEVGFGQHADALILLAIDGRFGLAQRHLAVTRAEAALNELLWPVQR